MTMVLNTIRVQYGNSIIKVDYMEGHFLYDGMRKRIIIKVDYIEGHFLYDGIDKNIIIKIKSILLDNFIYNV